MFILVIVAHCLNSVHIRSFSGPFSVQMRENMDQKISEYKHFSRSVICKNEFASHMNKLGNLVFFFSIFCYDFSSLGIISIIPGTLII